MAEIRNEEYKRKFYGLCNDYMFHLVLQKCTRALTYLVAALLGIPVEEVKSCEVQNPIELGRSITQKYCILDIKLLLNDDTYIDIELQIKRYDYWAERSLFYISRIYDNLHVGEDYDKLKTVIHIGILDFTLNKNHPKFFSEYRIKDIEDGTEYTDKLRLLIMNLTRIDEAPEGTDPELLRWARIIKAESMEEIRELTKGVEVLEEMAEIIQQMNEDERVKWECWLREDSERTLRTQVHAGERRGEKRGTEKNAMNNVINLMNNMKLSLEQALDVLGIEGETRNSIVKKLQK